LRAGLPREANDLEVRSSYSRLLAKSSLFSS